MENEKVIKILKKAANLEKGGSVALAKEFDSINEDIKNIDNKVDTFSNSIDTKLDNLSEELKKKLEQELVLDSSKEELIDEVSTNVEDKLSPKIELVTRETKKELLGIISDKQNEAIIEIRQEKNKLSKKHEEKMVEALSLIDEIKSIEVKNGIDGKDGSPDTGEEIVYKINELKTDDDELKIDAKHIKNLPQFNGKVYGGARNLYTLADVNIQSPTNGQFLKYNSTTKLWENGTGGGSGSQTLQDTTTLGNTTTDDIEITSASSGIILKSANGTRWRIGITNAGELTATSL